MSEPSHASHDNPLGDSLARLESHVSDADARGEAVPPELREMLLRLREVVGALDGLTAALGGLGDAAPPAPPAPPGGAAPEPGDPGEPGVPGEPAP